MKHTERHLPRQVDAFKLTQQGIVLDGCVSVSELPRLTEVLGGAGEKPVNIQPVLNFCVDDEGYRIARGEVNVLLPITCQRCLQVMPYQLHADINWAFVTSDEAAKKLPAHLDPVVLLPSGYFDVHEILEDELLLGLPITAFHENCEGAGETRTFGEVNLDEVSATEKPFAALAGLLKKD